MKKSFLVLFIFIGAFTFGQNRNLDSLWKVYNNTAQPDTNRLKAIHDIASAFKDTNLDSCIIIANQELKLARTTGQRKYEANALNITGVASMNKGNYPEALKNHFSALKIRDEIKDKKGIAASYNNIGIVYNNQGNYPEALKNFFAALKINIAMGNKNWIANNYGNIGNAYLSLANYPEALKNHFACLKIKEETGDKRGIASSYGNLGNIYNAQANYPEAVKNYFASLKIKEEMGDKRGVASSYVNMGELYIKLHKIKEASTYLNKGLQLSKEIGSKNDLKYGYASLVVLDSLTGNYKAAFEHHKLLILYRDSLNNEETKKKSLQTSMQYEFDKKEIAAKAEQERLDAITTEEKQKQKLMLYLISCILILVGVFSFFLYKRFRITNKQKKIIEEQKVLVDKAYEYLHEKNKEVMDSIHYAKRIQTALITSEKYIANNLKRLMKNN